MKKAMISGITGQDGSYLAELLLNKGYEVHGLIRRSSSFNTERIDHIISNRKFKNKFFFYHSDVTDSSSLFSLINDIKPDEIYNLAAQSHVKVSFDIPEYTANVDAIGTLRFLEAIKQLSIKTKFYQASTSELFGKVQEVPQKETTPFYPRSPYAVAKMYAYWILKNYRESYGIHASNGILFNHESPRRGNTFVTKKIIISAVRILKGLQDHMVLGNLNAKRDWGYAPEYVKGMWLMLQQDQPDDLILATGETHSIREFAEETFKQLGVNVIWRGEGENEVGLNKKTNVEIIKVSKKYFRPTEVELLVGDYSKAKKILNWEPKTTFSGLINIMLNAELKKYAEE